MRVLLRLRAILLVIALFFLAVELRLGHLQFKMHEFWEREAEATQQGGRVIPFQRGAIVDRAGRRIAASSTVHSLQFVPTDFRKKTPLGALAGSLKLLFRETHGGDTVPPGIRDLIARPDDWVKRVLDLTDADVETLTTDARGDILFYMRVLLRMTEPAFRDARAAAKGLNATFGELVPGARAQVVKDIRDHARALVELERAINVESGALIAAIETEVANIDGEVATALAKETIEATDPNERAFKIARAERLIRKDYESRERALADSIPYPAVCLVNVVPERYQGFDVSDVDRRYYAPEYKDLAPDLVGWVGPPTEELVAVTERDRLRLRELTSRSPEDIDTDAAEAIDLLRKRLRETDYLGEEEQGRTGLEGLLEPVLRGRRGWRLVEQDRARNDTKLLDRVPPENGLDVKLTLDAEMQRAAERVLDDVKHPGAIAIIDPNDGAILCLASWPRAPRDRIRKDYDDLIKDKDHPLSNRCYRPPGNPPPPGSVFKIVVTAAGLESGAISTGTTFTCNYSLPVDSKNTLHCDSRIGHGSIDLATAFQKSCNVWYYQAGAAIGFDGMRRMAEALGFGHPTGFGDPELLGLGPTSVGLGEIGCRLNKEPLSKPYTMRSAIGQAAFDDMTPLQVAIMPAAVANGGKAVHPFLIDTIGGQRARRDEPTPLHWKTTTVQVLKDCMISVCEPGGTAGPGASGARKDLDLRPWKVAGKTGTAQVALPGSKQLAADSAWFAGFLPHDRPKLSFAVYFENVGQHGGDFSGPVLQTLLEQPEMEKYR